MASTILPQFGGGMNKSMIVVTALPGSTVTCSNGSTTKAASEKDGVWTFRGLELGTWTVTAISGDYTQTKTVTLTRLSIEYLDLSYSSFAIVEDGVANYTPKARSAPFVAGYPSNNMQVTQEDGYVLGKGTQPGCGMMYFEGVDLTGITTLVLSGTFDPAENEADKCVFAVWSSIGTYLGDNRVASTLMTDTGATLDVSELEGEYIVGLTSIYTNEQKIVDLLAETPARAAT